MRAQERASQHVLPGGLIVPMLTPLTPEGAIHESATELLIEYVLRERVDGIFILGSAGEGDSLPYELQRDFAELVAARIDGRVPLFLGTMQAGTSQQTDFVRRCPVLEHCAAVVSPVPYYRRLRCAAEVREHYRRLREESGRPVVAYYTPHPSARVLTAPILLRLAEEGRLGGFKDSSGGLELLGELTLGGFNREGVRIYQGEPSLSLRALQAGADGLVVGTANFVPWIFVELLDAVRAGDLELAERCQERILAFRKFARIPTPYSEQGFHYSTFKAGLDVMDFGGGTPCPPYQRLPDDLLSRLRPYFAEAGVPDHAVRALLNCRLSQRARQWAQLRQTVLGAAESRHASQPADEEAVGRGLGAAAVENEG
jgi:4-hydroxy-tetrahydrodipicolinate synthase